MATKTFLKTTLAISLFLIVLTISATAHAKTIYVDDNAPGNNKGSTWANAYNDLRDAITDARSLPKPVEIRVAQGTYEPNESVFVLINGVTLKGGYAGFDESDPKARDTNLYKTILSGDCNGDDVEVIDPMDLWSEPTRADNRCVFHNSNCNETAVLDGFIIAAGRSLSGGGGMSNYNSSPTIINCTFSANTAGYDGYEGGGAIYNYYSNPVLINCEFIGNSAGDSCGGGGMYNDYSNPTMINCSFIGNTAEYCGGGMINFWSNPILTDCIFTDNFSPYRGGGMHNDSGSFKPILTNCTFIRNRSDGDGGGMYGSSHNSPILTNCTFRGNSAEECGGAICNGASGDGGGSPTINNCMFTGNRAGENGGAVHNGPHSNTILTRCTFSDNSASNGNALACNSVYQKHPSDLEITNCILWDGGDEIWNNDNSTITINYSDIQGGWPGEGNIDADPCFVEPGFLDANDAWIDGDYHLLPGSPCIDAGDPNYIAGPNYTDLDGKPRVIAGRIDMGAFEYQPRSLYVDDDAPNDPGPGNPYVSDPMEDGTPTHPFDVIQEAIDAAYDGDTIIVIDGTYFENINFNSRNITLRSTHPNNPDIVTATIIDGNNVESVVSFTGTENETCVLSGFTIQNGFHDYEYTRGGGGICGGSEENHNRATIRNNTIIRNFAWDGGGLARCDGLIEKNTITGNTSRWYMGGGGLYQCNGIIRNNLIIANKSGGCESGGGLSFCDGTIENNTITQNLTDGDGTVVRCRGTIRNCIIWGNIGWPPQLNMCSTPSFSCIQDWTGGGEGNIDTDPCFVDPGHWEDPLNTPYNWRDDVWVNGDYHLLPDSPCIDAGDPNYVAEPNGTDLDGNPRVINGRIDMGAYEYRFTISAEARIIPKTINLASKGKWITSYIWLPDDYDVAEIEPNSIFLEDEIPSVFVQVDEHNQFVTVRFTREEVQSILDIGEVELTITGRLTNGTVFEAADTIKVLNKIGRKLPN